MNQLALRGTRETLQKQISELHKKLDMAAIDDLPRTVDRLKTQLDVSERQWTEENQQVPLEYHLV